MPIKAGCCDCGFYLDNVRSKIIVTDHNGITCAYEVRRYYAYPVTPTLGQKLSKATVSRLLRLFDKYSEE